MSADKFEEWWDAWPKKDDIGSGFSYDVAREAAKTAWLASSKAALEEAAVSRIGFCDDGSLDEVVGSPGHLENLGDNHWFVTIGEYAIWLHSKSKITATYEHRPIRALIDKP